MARITVEDCLKKIDSQYDLVLLAKERTSQLNAGVQSLVPQDNDKNTVIALREIGEGKISPADLEDSAINKLRKNPENALQTGDSEEIQDDDFDKIYKGEVSKSGTAILPSKRVRQIPSRIELTEKTTKTDAIIKQEVDIKEEEKEEEEEEVNNSTNQESK